MYRTWVMKGFRSSLDVGFTLRRSNMSMISCVFCGERWPV
jgi:hypothetical protein